MRSIALLAAILFAGTPLACNESQPTPGATSAAPVAPTAVASVPTAEPSASASAAPSGSATAGNQATNALAGTWSGTYDSKKGEIVQPEGVKDTNWKKDDGKTFVGPGTVSVTIGPDGAVTGEAKGALGEQVIEGNTDGKIVGLRVHPKDPLAPQGFTGTLVVLPKDGGLEGELKCAGPTADVIRHAVTHLKKK